MKREDVENLLAQAAKFGALNAAGLGSRVPVDPDDLRALCERWLAVEDAPVVPVSEQVTYDEPLHALGWDSQCFKTTYVKTLRCDRLGRILGRVVVTGNGGGE